MRLRISRKFQWKFRIYRAFEMVFAMAFFTLFYIVQIPILTSIAILTCAKVIMGTPRVDGKKVNKSLYHNSKDLVGYKT